MIEANLHEGNVLSLCDSELIGKTFSEGDVELEISEGFYKGEHYETEELKKMVKDARNINAVGKESVGLLIEMKIVEEANVRLIGEVPLALIIEV